MNTELMLAEQIAQLRAEVTQLRSQSSTPRPLWTLKNRAVGDGTTPAGATLADMVTRIPAGGAVVEVADGTYYIDQDVTIPAHVSILGRNGGKLYAPAGVTVTINGGIDAGHYQIFDGPGNFVGTPKIDHASPDWFGAKGDGVTEEGAIIERTAVLHPKVKGRPDGRYLINTTNKQHTPIDIYSTGRVLTTENSIIQLPGGVWYGARLPSNAVVEDTHFVLITDTSAATKLHTIFVAGDAHYGETAHPEAQRLTAIGIHRCTFEVSAATPLFPYKFFLEENVPAGEVTWTLRDTSDFTRIFVGDQIRLLMDHEYNDRITHVTSVVSVNSGAHTVTVAVGPPEGSTAGNTVRGPLIPPLSILVAQSVDGVGFTNNTLIDAISTGTTDKLVGLYAFDCTALVIKNNTCNGIEKLAALDYCKKIQFNENIAWNCGQLMDLNKACFDIECNSNIFDRDEIDFTGDSIIELNGAVRFTAIGNQFSRGTRGFIVNTKGLVYRSWMEKMNQNYALTPEAQAENTAHAYHAVWQHVKLRGNHYEWMSKGAIYIGDSWKIFTTERVEGASQCGSDIEIDDTAINCGIYRFYSAFNGIVSIQEGKQIRVRMHIDNPDAIRCWVNTTATVGTKTIIITDPGVDAATLVGKTIRVEQDTDDNAAMYSIVDAVDGGATYTLTTESTILVQVSAGRSAWIGPGNCTGIAARSWIDTDTWTVTLNKDYVLSSSAAAGQPVISIADPGIPTSSFGAKQIRLTHDGGTVGTYTVFSVADVGATWNITFTTNLTLAAASGNALTVLKVPIVVTATGATAWSDLELLSIQGYIKNCAGNALYLYRASTIGFDGVQVEKCGSRARVRYAALVVEPEKRSMRAFGNINVDNLAELNQAGSAAYVDYGLYVGSSVTGVDLNDATKWNKTTKRMLRLYDSRLVGALTKDLEISDDVPNTYFPYVWTDGWSCVIPSQRMCSGMVIPISGALDFPNNIGGTVANNNVSIKSISVIGARKGDPVDIGYTAMKGSWQIESSCHTDNTVQVIATNRTGGVDSMTGGSATGWLQKI